MDITEILDCEYHEGYCDFDAWVPAHCVIKGVKNVDAIPDELVIPDKIGSYRVERIEDSAFEGVNSLRSLSVSVERIGTGAFKNCANLKSVTLGAGIRSIEKDAFAGCENIEEVHIEDLKNHCDTYFGSRFSNPLCFAKSLFVGEKKAENLEIPEAALRLPPHAFCGTTVKTVRFSGRIVRLDDRAFDGCGELTSFVLPNEGLIDLGASSFYGCEKLKYNDRSGLKYLGSEKNPYAALVGASKEITSVKPHTGTRVICNGAFENAAFVQEVELSDGVTDIGRYAFKGCKNLKKIVLSATVEVVHADAFKDCGGIREVHVPDIAVWCGLELGHGTSEYGAGPLVGADLYVDGKKVEEIAVPPEIKQLRAYAFAGCTSIKDVTLPEGLQAIDDGAFKNCPALESVYIPKSVKYVSRYAFQNCTALKSVTLPGVYEVEFCSFDGCTSLESVVLSSGTKVLEDYAFEGCTSLKSVEFPSELYKIGHYAFKNCASLESVTFPDLLGDIGIEAFYGCASLTEVILPKKAAILQDRAFENCTSLKRVEMFDALTHIGRDIFKGCLQDIEIAVPDKIAEKFRAKNG